MFCPSTVWSVPPAARTRTIDDGVEDVALSVDAHHNANSPAGAGGSTEGRPACLRRYANRAGSSETGFVFHTAWIASPSVPVVRVIPVAIEGINCSTEPRPKR